MQDPAIKSVHLPDGRVDQQTERRFEALFNALRNPASVKPYDQRTMLLFLQELHDRLSGN